MENIEQKIVDFDDLEFPETIYKYRDWSDKYHKTILTDCQVFMSPPLGFEDPLDCKNHVRYDLLTNEEIYSKYYSESKKLSPGLPDHAHKQFADYHFAKSQLHDKEYIKQQQEKDFLAFNERAGILCLTANPFRSEMWVKYSANHTGFCVGFNPKIMFKHLGGGRPVIYCDELPIIKPRPWDDLTVQMIKQIFHKQRKWAFEEEYRTQTFGYEPLTTADRVITLPIEAYKEIVFGAQISEENKNDIVSVAKKMIPHIKFRRAVIIDSNIIINDAVF